MTSTKRLQIVWIALSALTLLSWLLSAPGDELTGFDVPVTLGVLVAGYVKCRLILQHFMEVRSSGRHLRLFSEIWIACLFALVAAIYLYGSQRT